MKLSEKAQEYADWLASRGTFEHSETLVGKHRTFGDDGGPCGENMVYSEGREGAANMSGNTTGTSTLHCTYRRNGYSYCRNWPWSHCLHCPYRIMIGKKLLHVALIHANPLIL